MSKSTFTLKRKLFGGFAGSAFGRMIGANNWSNVAALSKKTAVQSTNLATKKMEMINPNTNKAIHGNIAGNVAKGIAKPIAVAGIATAGVVGTGALAAKGVASKASEQSDGSKLFSQINNKSSKHLSTVYTLKRKVFNTPNFAGFSTEKLERMAAQNVGAGNVIVEGEKKELSNRVPTIATTPPSTPPPPKPPTPPTPPKPPTTPTTPKPTTTSTSVKPTTTTNQSLMSRGKAYWNKMGTMGKVGVVGAGIVGAGLIGGMIANNKNKNKSN